VQEALATGALDADRYASYLKLQRELRSIEMRSSARLRREAKQRWRARARESRAARRYRDRIE
jgi:ribosome biogenesis GTPase